jgi:Outer membrane protein beta-barrel domain
MLNCKTLFLPISPKNMKKLFLAGALCIASVITYAQTKIAVTGGYTYSTARVSEYEIKKTSGYNSGYTIGVLFKAPFDSYLHFSPYIAYSRRGYTFSTGRTPDSAFSNKMSYIDFVPSLSIDIPSGENSFVLSAGFNVSLALSGTEKITSNGTTTSKKMKFDITSHYGLFDLGLNSSIAYHFPKFFVQAGYSLGLADINNQYDIDGRNIRNRMFSFCLGYYIR